MDYKHIYKVKGLFIVTKQENSSQYKHDVELVFFNIAYLCDSKGVGSVHSSMVSKHLVLHFQG